jgi:hypothetical protein
MTILSKVARYKKPKTAKGETIWVDTDPPQNIVKALPNQLDFPGVPRVTGLAFCPMLRADGTIVRESGYDPATGLILNLDGAFPESVSLEEAKASLDDILQDFPWESDAHTSAWIACLVTLVARHAIRGNTPFFLFDANVTRTGKGLASDLITMIAEGRRATRYMATGDEEMRKAITSAALAGSPYLCLDNIKGRLGGQSLENAMTTGTWFDRLLGGNMTFESPLLFVWMGTSNNATLTADMPGRTVHIRLNSPLQYPGERGEFVHPDLLAYVEQNRHKLAMSALAIPATYMAAGCPSQELPGFGGYQHWSDLVRNALVYCGYADPDTRQQMVALADDETDAIVELMDAWPRRALSIPEAFRLADEHDDLARAVEPKLHDYINQLEARDKRRKVGNMFRNAKNRVIDGRMIVAEGRRPIRWSVRQV